MPELPEVETVMQGLRPVMKGQIIAQAQTRRDGLRWPFPPRMAERLTGRRVLELTRRSKYILIALEGAETLLVHLGMSGRMIIHAQSMGQFAHDLPMLEKHDHVILDMAPPSGARIILNDARRFGAMDLIPEAQLGTHNLLKSLGPEPLGNDFSPAILAAAFAGRNRPVKSALLDQSIVAGLGNIYVCEALWRSGIHPACAVGMLNDPQIAALCRHIRDVLQDAILAGGSSLKDYRQANGDLGYFQHNFAVYGREGQDCPQCKGPIHRIQQSGRSSFYCETCQPAR